MHRLFILCDVNKAVVTINEGGAYGGQVAEEALQHPECQRLAEGERRKYGWKAKISYPLLHKVQINPHSNFKIHI